LGIEVLDFRFPSRTPQGGIVKNPLWQEKGIQCIAFAMQIGLSMKTTTIPSLRVSPELRKQAENVLAQGETLSGFVLEALTRSIEYRKSRQAFITRGLSNAARAKKTGKYVPVDKVIGKLARKLVKAKQRAA
jgi:predicted transcriptional regulator